MITSYAQNFEDVMLWRALSHIDSGFYIDIGAQDPLVDSVSLAFYEHGWRGVHVEPTARYADALRAHRPDETVIQAAVAARSGMLNFFEIVGTGISTADPVIAEGHRARGFELTEIVVPAVSLAEIFAMYAGREVHWLKIDVEGFELSVLQSWADSPARPWVVVVESTLPLTQTLSHDKWEAQLLERGYEPVYFDGLNRFYVCAEHPELRAAFDAPPNLFDGFHLSGTASAPFHALLHERIQQTSEQMQKTLQLRETELRDEAAAQTSELRGQLATARLRENAALESLSEVAGQLRQAFGAVSSADGAGRHDDRLIDELDRFQRLHSRERDAYRDDDRLMAEHLETLRAECGRLIRMGAAHDAALADALRDAEAATSRESSALRETREQMLRQQQDHRAELALQAAHAERREAVAAALHAQALERAAAELHEARAARRTAEQRHDEQRRQLSARLRLIRRRNRMLRQFALKRERQLENELLDVSRRHEATLRINAIESSARESRLVIELESARREFESKAREWSESKQQMSHELAGLRALLETERRDFTQRDAQAFERILDIEGRYARADAKAVELYGVIEDIRQSFSWKIMAPLRAVFDKRLAADVTALVTGAAADRGARSDENASCPMQGRLSNGSTAENQSPASTERNMSDSLNRALRENGEVPRSGPHRLRDFMAVDDAGFVVLAYRVLLRRDPDPSGFDHFLGRARRGDSRVRILEAIAQSDEGKINKVTVIGLNSAVSRLKIAAFPVIGPIFGKIWGYDEQRELASWRFASIDARLESIAANQAALLATHERKTADIQASITALSARFDALSAYLSTSHAVASDVTSGSAENRDLPAGLAAGVPGDTSPKSVHAAPVVLTEPDARQVMHSLSALVGASLEARMLAAR
ncbi:FkbM family methyltransferase [Burkholderia glumae]|uniref:FkbM family methyltransferase n=1 Tax=Burkholderia glumae TaxID=337 RepID=UPI002151A298|nr:FkbM family methyltransferase [Burkholderia glumae]UVS94908.1 FkbM family methyltransferase [Burkholderia glumae]